MASCFDILDHVDKLELIEDHPTWMRFKCPLCGDNNLKVNKEEIGGSHPYSCWRNECHKNGNIRKLFDISMSNRKFVPVAEPYIKSIFFDFWDTSSFLNDISFVKPLKKNYTTVYEYEEFSIFRFDKPNEKKTFDNSKIPSVFSKLPIYRMSYVEHSSIIYVEGEKSAAAAQKLNWNAFTIVNTCSEDFDELDVIFSHLAELGVTQVLVLPDNDIPGFRKAKKISRACWNNKIQCESRLLYREADYSEEQLKELKIEGFDIYDLIKVKKINKSNSDKYLQQILKSESFQYD